MNTPGTAPKGFPVNLFPHQSAFIETVLDPTTKPIVLLRADVGTGQIYTFVALARRLLKQRPRARILFIVHRGDLKADIVGKLRDAGVLALPLDRYRFREILDSATPEDLWPLGSVVVVTSHFARQPDIQDSFVEVHWDLLIMDEAPVIAEPDVEFLQKVASSSWRTILAATHSSEVLISCFPDEETRVVAWHTPLSSVPQPLLREVPYELTAEEFRLHQTVYNLIKEFEGSSGGVDPKATVILMSLESSLAAIEHVLIRQRGGYANAEETSHSEGSIEGRDPSLSGRYEEMVSSRGGNEIEMAERALQEIEAISDDSKMDAFGRLLNEKIKEGLLSRKICVLTEFAATLYYLAAEIEGSGTVFHLLHGGMSAGDQQKTLEKFSQGTGILVSTIAMMREGIDLPQVTDLILYDISSSKISLQQVLGRFDRYGRVDQLLIHALVPSNIVDGSISRRLELLRVVLDAEA